MAEVDVVRARRRVLIFEGIPRHVSQLRESKPIELGWTRPEIRIKVQGVGTDHYTHSAGNRVAAWELQSAGVCDDSGHIRYGVLIFILGIPAWCLT